MNSLVENLELKGSNSTVLLFTIPNVEGIARDDDGNIVHVYILSGAGKLGIGDAVIVYDPWCDKPDEPVVRVLTGKMLSEVIKYKIILPLYRIIYTTDLILIQQALDLGHASMQMLSTDNIPYLSDPYMLRFLVTDKDKLKASLTINYENVDS